MKPDLQQAKRAAPDPIGRGFIGSYDLTFNDSDRVFKMTRVK